MTKIAKPIRAIGAKPTQEELEEQAKRAFLQKRNSIAEGVLFNAVRNIGPECSSAIMAGIVDLSIEAADRFMQKAYGLEVKEK